MRVPHIYQASPIVIATALQLEDDAAGHIGRVLRMKVGEHISLFNGQGGEYLCELIEVGKNQSLQCRLNLMKKMLNHR